MKQKWLVALLGLEAIFCVLFQILQGSLQGFFSAALAFPFEQIGWALRALSLASGLGNVLAFVLYAALCLLPLAFLLLLGKRRKLRAEDGLLGLLSIALFIVLYFMINPGLIGNAGWAGMAQSFGKAALGGTLYSIVIAYLVLRALRLFSQGDAQKLLRYMGGMLRILSIIFVYIIFGAAVRDLLDAVKALQAGNIGNEYLLGSSYVFLVLQYIADTSSYVLNLLIVFAGMRLLRGMRINRYAVETVALAKNMARLCAVGLAVTVLIKLCFNLLQCISMKSLLVMHIAVDIPLFSIVFVLSALIVSLLIAENKTLKEDNDMFI